MECFERCGHRLGVTERAHLLEHGGDTPGRIDDEGRAVHPHVRASHESLFAPHAIALADRVIGVGDERVGKPVLLLELCVLLDRVRADANDRRADSLEPREGVLKAGRLERSTRGVVARIEEQDDPRSAEVGERQRSTVVDGRGELRCVVPDARYDRH
jgi:hypothetical protein